MIETPPTRSVDLRRAPLADLRAVDLRAPSRSFWDDETALWDRFTASWAGLDDGAWALPGAAPSDAGGADWSLAEHVGHVADWQELAIEFVGAVLATGRWPADEDYDGGDFDTWNERRREPWASMAPAEIRDRLEAGRTRLVEVAHGLPLDVILGDAGWGWVYGTLHGHRIDHLAVMEPWSDALRTRQVDGDPFVADPRVDSHAALVAGDDRVLALFDAVVRPVQPERWTSEALTPGWTLKDHVAHLADWAEEGIWAIELYRSTGTWPADPEEGIDAWNHRQVRRSADATPAGVLTRFGREHARLREAVATLSLDELRSADGWGWTYDCLYGHVRKHLALVGPWCARVAWPDAAVESPA